MTSSLEEVIKAIQVNNYFSLAIITAVGYDYILTFSREIEYIWTKPWRRVSTMFVIARYSGLCYAIFSAITGSSFLPGPPAICEMGILLYSWGFWLFVCAADFVMILRVWALYNQSRLVLGALVVLYVIEVVSLLARYLNDSISLGGSGVDIARVLQFTFCVAPPSASSSWLVDLPFAVAIALGTLMCIFTAFRFRKEFLEVYKKKRRFHLNRYMKCLARDAAIYFIVVLLFSVFTLLSSSDIQTASGWLVLVAAGLEQIPPVTLIPRFILSLRELDTRDVGASNGTTLGFGSEFGHGAARNTLRFAGIGQDEDEDEGDEIQMEEWVQDVRHVESRA